MSNAIKKLEVRETVLFAINHIPQVDKATLEKFLDLIYATGAFGAMTHEQILTKMALTLKYIPDACPRSLMIVADLLEIPVQVAQSNLLLLGSASETPIPLYEPLELRQEVRP